MSSDFRPLLTRQFPRPRWSTNPSPKPPKSNGCRILFAFFCHYCSVPLPPHCLIFVGRAIFLRSDFRRVWEPHLFFGRDIFCAFKSCFKCLALHGSTEIRNGHPHSTRQIVSISNRKLLRRIPISNFPPLRSRIFSLRPSFFRQRFSLNSFFQGNFAY